MDEHCKHHDKPGIYEPGNDDRIPRIDTNRVMFSLFNIGNDHDEFSADIIQQSDRKCHHRVTGKLYTDKRNWRHYIRMDQSGSGRHFKCFLQRLR